MSEQDSKARRKLLQTVENPSQRLDYIITFSRKLALGPGKEASLKINYIPDRQILDQAAIPAYMQALEGGTWQHLEPLAAALLDDLGNELVARWVEISLSQTQQTGPQAFTHAVVMDECQPGWSNPQLLSRLKPWETV